MLWRGDGSPGQELSISRVIYSGSFPTVSKQLCLSLWQHIPPWITLYWLLVFHMFSSSSCS